MPKFILDEDLSRSTAQVLRELGHEVRDVRDTVLKGATDDLIYASAQQEHEVLFSADMGFANIQKFPLGTHWGIVITRFPNKLSTREINKDIKASLSHISESDFKGNLIIIELGRIRLRKFKQESQM